MVKSFRTLGAVLALLVSGLLTTAFVPGEKAGDYGPSGGADKTLAPYFVVLSDDPKVDALPLKSTRADVKIAGVVAEVKITQVYRNTGKKTLEAIYVFPGSTRAAVNAMRMTIGDRVVDAKIMEREKARETYEQAKKEGKTTSLLEQQRPNVFQMNVANILPGDEIKVELKYMELLTPEDHIYEFVYPTVVGPRYTTKTAEGAVDTDKWVQNPYLHEGQAPPYTFGLAVELSSGVPIASVTSPSHEVEIKYAGKTSAQIKLKNEETGGNKDFVLRYALAGGKIETGLLLYPGQEENFFMLMMEPPARVKADAVLPREYIFIVDISGSMYGFPLDTAKALMQNIIKDLKPQDFMNVVLFASGSSTLSPAGSLPANEANKQKALAFIHSRPGGGGTNIVPALDQALGLPRTEGVSRIVAVATDGYVDVEPRVFQLIRDHLGAANLFAFGIGTSVNRHLIEGMARAGMGETFVVLNAGEAAKQAARFRQYIANPVLTDIKVAYEGFSTYEVEPVAVPDLFAMRPLTILGKYRGNPTGAIVVKGKTAQGPYEHRIKLEEARAGSENAALRLLWARQRIMNLVDFSQFDRGNQEVVKEVTALGLKYSLMTPYTSFVAVDQVKRADGQVVTVKQPLPLPEGVSDLAVGGGVSKMAMMPASPSSPGLADERLGYMGGGRKAKVGPHGGGSTAAEPGVSVTVKDVQVKGGLTPAAVQKALEDELAKLTQCCQDAAKAGLKLPAEITVTFTIGTDGKITEEPKVTLAAPQKSLEKCLATALQGIQFPQPQPAAVPVTVTLSLTGK
ncbi:MAG: VIT domain-containing protein [Desulfobaccales bacterium]